MQIIKSSSKKGDSLKKSLKEKGGGESLRKAIEQRDRLLEYNRNSEKRTTVIDDEMDYFQVLVSKPIFYFTFFLIFNFPIRKVRCGCQTVKEQKL